MPSCELIGHRFSARVDYRVTQDVGGNCSAVEITGVAIRSMWEQDAASCWVVGTIRIDGTQAARLWLSNTESCGVILSREYFTGSKENWSGFETNEVLINHLADGSGELTLGVDLRMWYSSGTALDPGINGEITAALPRIPRASELAAAGVTLGQDMTIRLSRQVDRFRDRVRWHCGSEGGVLAESTQATQLRWRPAAELARQAPDSEAVTITLQVESFDGDIPVGSRELPVVCAIPKTVVPSLRVEVADAMGHSERHGGYIRSRSRAKITTQAEGALGSSVVSIRASCGSLTGEGGEVTFALEDSGRIPLSVTVTDSRGRSAHWFSTIHVLPYEKPWAAIRQAFRCDSQGNSQPDGGYMKLVFDGGATRVENGSLRYGVRVTIHGAEDWSAQPLPDYDNQFSLSGGSVVLPAGVDSGYDCVITAEDAFGLEESPPVPVGVAFVLMDMNRQTKALGLGMRARTAGVLSIGMDVDLTEHRILNLPEPLDAREAATKAYVDSRLQALASAMGIHI